MIKMKIGYHVANVPTNIQEVTFSQYKKLLTEPFKDTFSIASIFTGVDAETLKNVHAEDYFSLLETINVVATQVFEHIPFQKEMSIPLCAGQIEDIKTILEQHKGKEDIYVMDKVYAIGMDKQLNGAYDGERALGTLPKVQELPFLEVQTAYFFFVKEFVGYLNASKRSYPKPRLLLLKKLKQALKTLLQNILAIKGFGFWLKRKFLNTKR